MKKVKYPPGPVSEIDWSKASKETILYEVELCQQILYGIKLTKYNTELVGMLDERYTYNLPTETFLIALANWKYRYERAKTALVERELLEDSI